MDIIQKFLILMLILLIPAPAMGYGYQYMKENRQRMDERAAKILVTREVGVAFPYRTLGPVAAQAKEEEQCIQKLRRHAVRKNGDGIIQLKTLNSATKDEWSCEGLLIRLND